MPWVMSVSLLESVKKLLEKKEKAEKKIKYGKGQLK